MLETLKQARELISDPNNWVRGRFGQSEDGKNTGVRNIHKAVKFCSIGALYKVEEDIHTIVEAKEQLELSMGEACASLSRFNDESTHDEVLALFNTTIERLENDGND